MKLTTITQVSVDGVMQANGGRHPILDPGMERGGWARPPFDNEAMTFVDQTYQRADAFLFGRRTYGPDIALDLVASQAFPKGITAQVYRPTGRPQYATT